MRQEMVEIPPDGSSISWTICKQSAPRSRQITTPTPHHSNFYRSDALPDAGPTNSIKALKAKTSSYYVNKRVLTQRYTNY